MIRSVVAGILLVAAALSACSGPDDPAESTPSSTPAPTAPTMPEIAHDDSVAGAEAFVSHYIDVLNYAAVTGETDELRRLSADDCSGCAKYIDLFEQTYSDGGYFTGGEWSVEDIHIEFDKAVDEQYATVDVAIAAGSQKSAPEDAETDTPTNRVTVVFALHDSEARVVSQFALGEPK